MKALRVVVRIVLSVGVAFMTIPVWLWVFERFNFPEWGFFHSGLPHTLLAARHIGCLASSNSSGVAGSPLKLDFWGLQELSQPTYSISNAGKIVIDKSPDGMPSPNRTDSVVIAYNPGDSGIETWRRLIAQAQAEGTVRRW